MNISLVQCPNWGTNMPPLGLSYVSAYLKSKGHKVTVFDFNIELFDEVKKEYGAYWKTGMLVYDKIWTDETVLKETLPIDEDLIHRWTDRISDTGAEIIGFSVACTTELLSTMLAEEIKRRDQKKIIVFGGPLCFDNHKIDSLISKDFVDIIVVGEGEETFAEIIDIIREKNRMGPCLGTVFKIDGRIIKCGPRPLVKNLDLLPFPDYGDFPLEKYEGKNSISILMSRGCTNRCAFCSEGVKLFRCRSAENVVREMKQNYEKYNVRDFAFNDSLINGNIQLLEELCNLLVQEKLDIRWNGQLRICPQMTPELLKKMRAAGCCLLVYGVESASQKIIDRMGKNFNVKDAQKVLKDTYNAGITTVTNWILGFPGETTLDFLKSLWFIYTHRNFIKVGPPWGNPCVILPNSPIAANPGAYGISKTGSRWHTAHYGNTRLIRNIRTKVFRMLTNHYKLDIFR